MLNLTNDNLQDFQELKKIIAENYNKAIFLKKHKIRKFSLSLYGFIPFWYEKDTSNVFAKIRNFMENANSSVGIIKQQIQSHLCYNACFYVFKEGIKIPITFDRIEQALVLVNNKASIIQVENALYF